ncbi:MAG: hypothetical protein KA144_05520 [Xanthomonadaceae bacterium]|nr:hypothetical protein [Xanthomonadaceae bacterium]
MKAIAFATLCAFGFASMPSMSAEPAPNGVMQRTERGRLVHAIVMKWGDHVRTTYRIDVRTWAGAMGSAFGTSSIQTLRNAANARSFHEMNNAFIGSSASPSSTSSVPPTKYGNKTAVPKLGDSAGDLVFVPVTPCRLFDTRQPLGGGPIAANTTRTFDVTEANFYSTQGGDASDCAIGTVGKFAAAAINFTVVTPNGAGFITAFPTGATRPLAATVNYTAGDIRGNFSIVKIDQTPGTVNELSIYSFAQTDVVGDIVGYFIASPRTALECIDVPFTTNVSAGIVASVQGFACPPFESYMATGVSCTSTNGDVHLHSSGLSTHTLPLGLCGWDTRPVSTPTTVTVTTRCCRIPGR